MSGSYFAMVGGKPFAFFPSVVVWGTQRIVALLHVDLRESAGVGEGSLVHGVFAC